MKDHPLRYGHIIAACSLAALLLTISIVCFTPSFAQKSKKSAAQKSPQEQPVTTTVQDEQIIHVDSNGIRHEYNSFDELPAAQKAQIKTAIKKGMKAAKLSEEKVEEIQDQLKEFYSVNVDSITRNSMKKAELAMNGVDWDAIGKQIDSAMDRVVVVDWPSINRQVRIGLSEARRTMADPQWQVQVRREVANAKQQASAIRGRQLAASQRSLEEARQEMEQAERRMEQAHQEIAEARAELIRIRRKYSIITTTPGPPTPPSSNGIPVPATPPAPLQQSQPSAAPPVPAAPPAGSYRK